MQIDRQAGYAPASHDVARQVAMLRGPCLNCSNCRGLCHELIEMLSLPRAVLKAPRRS